jgi:hypothetical protein
MNDGSTWVSSAGRLCTALFFLVLMTGAERALAQTCTDHPGDPTEPPTGMISLASPSVDFDSKFPPPAGAALGPADCVGPNCSRFELTVSGDPASAGKIVRVKLAWILASNDYDLYIFDPACQQVGSSGNGLTTFEEAVFTPSPNTTYEVVIVHFAAVGDQIDGVAFLDDAPEVRNPNRTGPTGTGIVFSPNGTIMTSAGEAPTGKGTVMAPEAFSDGEPSARVDVRGNQYPAGIRGVPAGVDVWRFGPDAYCPRFTFHDDEEFPTGDPSDGYVWLGQPDGIFATDGAGSPDAGGGDIELAVSFPADATSTPVLSMVSLTLANITAAASFDRGNNWTPANAFSATAPPADRQWIEAFGTNTVYLYYRTLATLTGLVLQKSIDNGITYSAGTTIVNPLGFTPGWIDVDQSPNPDGSVDIYLSAQNSSELVIFHCVDPNPALPLPITCSTPNTVDDTMSHGHIFDVVTVGNDGTVYAAWSNNKDIFYAYSRNKAQTWSGPVQVTGGAGMTETNIFPWITAGDNNRIGIVWYGTDALTNADNNAEWKAYYAFTANARANTPDLLWLPASDHVIHKSNVSQAGFSPGDEAVNRNLIDFFEVAHDPRDGAAVVAFTDDHNDFDGHTFWTRQIAGPGLRAGTPVTTVPCPPLMPFSDPEVEDFLGDGNGVSGALGPSVPDVDILNVDYGSEEDGGTLYLTSDMAITALLALAPERSYRSFFAVNTARGLMDAGNMYFIELTTQNTVTEFWLGVAARRPDGTIAMARVENIAADQSGAPFTPGAPGQVHVRVDVNRLDYSYIADGTPMNGGSSAPGSGDLVIGLIGQTRHQSAIGSAVVADNTRGGSFIILGEEDGDGVTEEVECTDPAVTQFGGWQVKTTDSGEKYCRNVGNQGKDDPSKRPYLELSFPGNSDEVRYDYFTGPRGGFVEVIIDGQTREIINQNGPGSDQSGQKDLQPQSRSYVVGPQTSDHTIRVVHRTDLEQGSMNIGYVDGFAVTGGASGSAASADQAIIVQNTLAGGATIDHAIVADLGTLFVGAVVEPVSASLYGSGALVVEIYNPAGLLIERSSQAIAPVTASAVTIVPGKYTVRIRNTSDRAVAYQGAMLRTRALQ